MTMDTRTVHSGKSDRGGQHVFVATLGGWSELFRRGIRIEGIARVVHVSNE